jgi:acyl-CoA hydrolase
MRAAAEAAPLRIAEVNDRMPRTYGDTRIHVSQLDAIVEVSAPLPAIPPGTATDLERRIAEHVAGLVDDGATLQLGRGGLPDAVLGFLKDKRDLGIHTELYSDTVVDMVQRGVITGARKTLHTGKLVAGFLDGSQKLYDFVHENPMVEMHRSEYVNDPAIIGQHDNLVAINSAVEVDLTGQINAESVGSRLLSGAGGQLDFALGAWRARNGKYIVAMPSTAGANSRIVARLGEGAAVTVPRTLAQFVVTEYGVADLRGKALDERARALIAIAHPDHREALERAARERQDLHI